MFPFSTVQTYFDNGTQKDNGEIIARFYALCMEKNKQTNKITSQTSTHLMISVAFSAENVFCKDTVV